MSDPAWCRVTAEERARLRQAEVAHAMESMLLEAAALATVAATERERRELLVRNVLVDRYLYFHYFCPITLLDYFTSFPNFYVPSTLLTRLSWL